MGGVTAIRHEQGPASFAGLSLDRPRIMGIVNVTPDSFSDGGDFLDPERAVAHGHELLEAGADILDVGGESTRPGADPVAVGDEIARVLPVVEALAKDGALVSIDSRHAAVMRAALDAGAAIINDVTALTGHVRSLPLAVEAGVPVVLMHMRGEPGTMQADPAYDDVVEEVHAYLAERLATCVAAGVPRENIAVDPGIGFGKTLDHNLALLANLDRFRDFGCPVLLGASRKSFIGMVTERGESPKQRVGGSIAAALAGVTQGADILRVHDVAETRQALEIWSAIRGGR